MGCGTATDIGYTSAMINDSSIQLRAPRLLNLSVYLTLIIMIVISFVRPPDAAIQGVITALCVAIGLVHTFGFRDIHSVRRGLLYFGVQTLLVTALYVVSGMSDAFYFLFFILNVQAMLVLSARGALVWMVCFFLIGCAGALWSRGADGLVSILFNISAYGFITAYGYTLRQVDATCNQNEQLVGELRSAQQQLHDLAVAEERNRLARDLHDSTKQQAFALSAQLDAVRSLIGRDPSAAERHLHQAEQLADSLRQELAAMILDLRPPALGQQSLPGALRAMQQSGRSTAGSRRRSTLRGSGRCPWRWSADYCASPKKHWRTPHVTVRRRRLNSAWPTRRNR
jgi:signal transduction histidine kinase